MDKDLLEKISSIKENDKSAQDRCQKIWDQMGKPIGSLGLMEELYIKAAAIKGDVSPKFSKKALVVMCADNGVVDEGVTQTGSEVTAIVAENFFDNKTTTAILCKKNNCDLYVYDIGMNTDTKRTIRIKTKYGTNNFVNLRAMSYEDAVHAVSEGMRIAIELAKEGYDVIATGEMGIGNTTTSSAVCSTILGVKPESVTGKGAGLSNEGLAKKIQAINNGIKLHSESIKKDKYKSDAVWVLNVLSCIGGFDICGMTGLFLGGAYAGIPVIIDGFISAVAALCAVNMNNRCRDYMLASHMSAERASQMLFEALGCTPVIQADMRLGEGSGAVMLMPILDMIEEVFDKMGTFEDIGVKTYEKFN